MTKKTETIQKQPVPQFRTQYNRALTPSKGEVNNSPSQTIEGESYTIPEILYKYRTGQLVNIGRDVIYSGTDDFEEFDPTSDPDFDIIDAHNLMSEIDEKKLRNSAQTTKQKAPGDITEQKTVEESEAPDDKSKAEVEQGAMGLKE